MTINLLPSDIQSKQKRDKQTFVASGLSIAFLVTLIVAVSVVFSYRFVVTREFNQVTNDLNDLKTLVADKKAEEGNLKAIHTKLEKIDEIFTKHYPYGTILQDLDARTGPSIILDDVVVENQDTFTLIGSTDSLNELASYLKQVDEEIEEYTNFTLERLQFNETDFRYLFEFQFTYVPSVES